MPSKVLVVDDDPESRRLLKMALEGEGYVVIEAADGVEAFDRAVESDPDLVVSDITMPRTDGLELCRRLKGDRRTSSIPVVLLSGVRREAGDQADGLEGGADDYLVKPVQSRLLRAKVKAVLRRGAPPAAAELLQDSGLKLDLKARTASLRGKTLRLTRKEFDLLAVFLGRPHRVLSPSYLLETVWGHDPAVYNDPRTLQVHLSSLRKKLGPAAAKRFTTLPGLGYRFD